MRRVSFDRFGPPDVLAVELVAEPVPGVGEASVRVEAIGVNYTDIVLRSGDLGPLTAPEYLGEVPALPAVPGMEGAGVVERVGPGVETLRPGDRVAFDLVESAYAELVVGPASALLPLPDEVPFEIGAALPLQGLTAFYLTRLTHVTKSGEVVLIHAAAGGVGLLAIQLAKLAGATVIATASTAAKADLAREFGADHALDYSTGDFVAEVMRITDGEGADLVLDGVGRATLPGSLAAAAFHGQVITYGWPSGVPDPIQPLDLMPRALSLTGGNLIRAFDEAARRAAFAELCELHAAGDLRVRIGAELPLAEAAAAHEMLESRASSGKILLRP